MANAPLVQLNVLMTDGSTVFRFCSTHIPFNTTLVNVKFESFPTLDDVEIYRAPPGIRVPVTRGKKNVCLQLLKLIESPIEKEALEELHSAIGLRSLFNSVEDAEEQQYNIHLLLVLPDYHERADTVSQIPVIKSIFKEFPPRAPSSLLGGELLALAKDVPGLSGRPHNSVSHVPVTLLDESLATFSELCRTGEPTQRDCDCANVLTTLSDFFGDEVARVDRFRSILKQGKIVKLERASIDGSEYKTDGSIFFDVGDTSGRALGVSVEGKLEVGCAGAEPYMQSGQYYFEQMRYLDKMGFCKNSYFPCLLLLHFGPYVKAVGAVFTDQPILQPLAEVFLHFHPTDDRARLNLERFVLAIRVATSALEEKYANLKINKTPSIKGVFPYKNSYTDAASTIWTFTYTRAFSEDDKYVYFGTTNINEKIVIKFIKPGRYSEDATEVHRFAAEHGFAPSLLAVEPLPAEWVMIVMQDLSDRYHEFSGHIDSTPSVRNALNEAIKTLHSANYVHGDLRAANILVHDDRSSVQIIDWDWSGIVGTATYPSGVNTQQMWRPDTVIGRGKITADHDLQMIAHRFKKQTRSYLD